MTDASGQEQMGASNLQDACIMPSGNCLDEVTDRYDDIIDLPHHVSQTHPQMTTDKRAAQFAPFAALTGYDEAIDEATRHSQE